jgi:lysozyme
MASMSRRRFLKATACGAAGAGVLGAMAAIADDGTNYALQGIDVSHWQGSINWNGVRSAGKRYAICKATEGLDYTDPTFATNYAGIRAAGLLRSAYHMGHPAVNAAAQADFFYDTVQPQSGDLPLVLDLEKTDSMTPTQVRSFVVGFVNRLTTRLGRAPIIYAGFYFWRDSAGNGSNLGCPLWLAAYNNTPLVPAAWSAFSFWQYSSTGSVAGLNPVDLDACALSKTALNNLRLP